MMPTVNLSDATFARLQKLAVPLVDDIDSVIAKLLDKTSDGAPPDLDVRQFDPASPPNLAFSSVKSASVQGKALEKSIAHWNGLMMATIRAAHAAGLTPEQILDVLTVNAQAGRKEDSGYKFIEEVGVSVQGQDANAAFRQAYKLAVAAGLKLEVAFVWSNVAKAANPGVKGKLSV